MKIKHDYVTNSSSTCYILALPENYNPDRKEIVLAIEESCIWSLTQRAQNKHKCLKEKDDLMNLIYSTIDDMKNGHTINKFINRNGFDSEDSINILKFEAILVLMKDLILTEVEIANEHGQDRIFSISSEKIEKAFFRNNSEKITKSLKKIVQEE